MTNSYHKPRSVRTRDAGQGIWCSVSNHVMASNPICSTCILIVIITSGGFRSDTVVEGSADFDQLVHLFFDAHSRHTVRRIPPIRLHSNWTIITFSNTIVFFGEVRRKNFCLSVCLSVHPFVCLFTFNGTGYSKWEQPTPQMVDPIHSAH